MVNLRNAVDARATTALALGVGFSLLAVGVGSQAVAASTTITVSNASQLTAALASVTAGQTIALADGTYVGTFLAKAQGQSTAPITITGSRQAVLSTGSTSSGSALTLSGDNWRLTGFSVSGALRGIVLVDADTTLIESVEVASTGRQGISVTAGSRDVTIRDSFIRNTGVTDAAQGDGIAIGTPNSQWIAVMGSATKPDQSDRFIIEGNNIRDTAGEGIDVREGTSDGLISGNVFSHAGYSQQNSADSWVDLKGDSTRVELNVGTTAAFDAFQVHSVLEGWGGDNVFADNTVDGVPGYEVRIESTERGNLIACGSTSASLGMTNGACQGSKD